MKFKIRTPHQTNKNTILKKRNVGLIKNMFNTCLSVVIFKWHFFNFTNGLHVNADEEGLQITQCAGRQSLSNRINLI